MRRSVASLVVAFCSVILWPLEAAAQRPPAPSRVVAWGFNSNGQLGFADDSNFHPDAVVNLGAGSGVTKIAAGTFHSLALKSDGTVWAWGLNGSGQLGDGAMRNNRLVPVQVTGTGSGIVALAGGNAFSMALKSDGTVLTWGANANGQLGDGTTTSRSTPGPVSGLGAGSGVIAIAAGGTSAYALKSDGTVLAWGNNANGRLGDGTTTQRLTPVQVSGLGPGSGIIAVAADSEASHVLALKSNGAVVAWGHNVAFQLGDGTRANQQTAPVAVTGLGAGSGVVALAAGGAHSLALKGDGSVLSWGFNSTGQLGDGWFAALRTTPGPVSGLGPESGVIAITAGQAFSMALKLDGTALSWGSNSNFQLGSDAANACCSATPLLVTRLAAGLRLAAGNNHALAVTSSGSVLSWGGNARGQLGKNSIDANAFPTGTFNNDNPADGQPLSDVIAVSGGSNFSLALKSDGTVRSWGSNTSGQLGDGFMGSTFDGPATQVRDATGTGFLRGITAIAAGNTHGAALQSDGTVWTWGNNANGQLGDGTTAMRLLPVQVSGFGPGSVRMISAGNNHNLALKVDGSVWAWGGNANGQLGDGTTTESHTPVQVSGFGIGSGVAAIAAGNGYSLAMKADGTVWSWGTNASGQLGDGTLVEKLEPVQVKDPTGTSFLMGVTAIDANGSSLALKSDGTVWSWGSNNAGQLGDGSFTNSSLPVQVAGVNGATAIASGTQNGLAMKSDGTVWTWGFNLNGNLGNGTFNGSPFPVQALVASVGAIAAGTFHNLALVPMTVSPVTLSFDTSTPGVHVQFDGINFIAGTGSVVLMPGTSFSVSTTSPQAGPAGTRYVFSNWSDGGAISHVAAVPNSSFALSLNFTTQYLLTTSVAPAGGGTVTVGSSSADGFYNSGTNLQLAATPAPGYLFTGWSGDLSGTTNPQSLVMSSPRNVTANFAAAVQITVNSVPPGRSIIVDSVTYTAPQVFQWLVNSSHTIATTSPQEPTHDSRFVFHQWSDRGPLSHTVTAPSTPTTYTADFGAWFLLTLLSSPSGSGTFVPWPPSIYGDGFYTDSAIISVKFNPDAGHVFQNFSGDLTGSANPQSVVMDNRPRTVTANTLTLTPVQVTTVPAGRTVTVDGQTFTAPRSFYWIPGTTHSVSVAPYQYPVSGGFVCAACGGVQYVFDRLSLDGTGISTTLVAGPPQRNVATVTAPALGASSSNLVFDFRIRYSITTKVSPSNGGAVTLSPTSADGFYDSGANVQARATPTNAYRFGTWTGDLSGATNPQTITVNAPKTVTANFIPLTSIVVTTSPPGRDIVVDGTHYVSPAGFVWAPGSSHSISTTATQTSPGARYYFTSWSDNGALTHNVTPPAGVTTYTAIFRAQYQLTTTVVPVGAGAVSPGGGYLSGSVVPIGASAYAPAYSFSGWTGPVASASSSLTTVTMNGPVSVTANFTPAVRLTTAASGVWRLNRLQVKRGNTTITFDAYLVWVWTCNYGALTASNVQVTAMTLNGVSPSSLVPQTFPTLTLGPGQCGYTADGQYFVAGAVGASGTTVPWRYSIRYSGGSPILTSTMAALP